MVVFDPGSPVGQTVGMTRSGPRHVPSWLETATSVAWRTLVVAAAGFVFVLMLSRLTVIVVPVIGALFVSAILVPPARWLRRHGWPALLATWATFLASAAIVVGALGLVMIFDAVTVSGG